MAPEKLIESGFVRLVKGIVAAPAEPTCNGNTIDYFIVAESLGPSIVAVHKVEDSPFQPHSPVRLLLAAAPRKQLMRVQVKPRKVEAKLPQGCLNWYEDEWSKVEGVKDEKRERWKEMDLDNAYREWLKAAERVWGDIEADNGQKVNGGGRTVSRSEGPKFVWVLAAGKPAVND